MTDKWIVLLGGNELNAGFCAVAADWGAKLAVVDWNEKPAIACNRHFRLDIKASQDVVRAVAALPGEILLAYTSADVAAETAAQVNAAAGFARSSQEAIARAGNKIAMNAAWAKAGLIGKRYRACATAGELADFAVEHGGKLIIKPASSSSSRGITVVEADEIGQTDWPAVFERARGGNAGHAVLAEEYVEGTEFTVEMIGDAEGNVEVWGISKKYHTVHTHKNRIAVKLHYNPPDVPRASLERIAAFAGACYRSLGLTCGVGHFEVLQTRDGRLVPVEIAARSSGFIATHLVSVLSAAPGAYLARYREALLGHTVPTRLIASELSSMYFFYDPPPGVWTEDDANLMDDLPDTIRSLAHERTRLRKGARLGRIDTDNERYGYEVLAASANDLRIELLQSAEAKLYARAVEPEGAARALENSVES